MARIAGIDLPVQKRLWIGLTSIYGIGRERAKKLAAKAGVDYTKKIRDLTEEEINHIRQAIEQEGRVEGDLRKEIQMNIRRLIEIQAYRGIRHRRNLPVRGEGPSQRRRRRSARRASFQQSVGAQHAASQLGKVSDLDRNDRSETWQKNQRPQEQHRIPGHRENRQRQRSVRKSSRRSASGVWFRTGTCISRRPSTTRRSPSRIRMAA